MFPSFRKQSNIGQFLNGKRGAISKLPLKYSAEDCDFANNNKLRIVLTQQRLVDRLQAETHRVIDEVTETTRDCQREVEHQTNERVAEIQFFCDELNKQKKVALLEKEALTTYRSRVKNALDFLQSKSLSICKQCIAWREMRIGVDLCNDEVDRQLCLELKTIQGCQELVAKTLKEAEEIIRKLCVASLQLDEDLEFKNKALLIDKKNASLKQYHKDRAYLKIIAQWKEQTFRNLEINAKELNSATQMRGFIDLLLQQICEDMRNQTESTNLAFEKNIRQIKHMKRCLEDKHNEIMASVMDVQELLKVLQQIEHSDRVWKWFVILYRIH